MAGDRIKLPHTLTLVFGFVMLIAVFTWIIPGGHFERTFSDDGRELVIKDSFHYVDKNPQGLFALLKAPIRGFGETAQIIGFIFLVGGVFAIIQKSRAVDISILHFSEKISGREILVIPAGMLLFSLFGAIFGMSEEVIPFVLIFIPMALALGYDSIVGIAIPFLGAGIGFAGAFLNPFTVGIGQGISGLPLFSGIEYRITIWAILTIIGSALVIRYARQIKKQPQSSPVYHIDQRRKKTFEPTDKRPEFTLNHKLVLYAFAATILIMIFGVMKYQWFIDEIAALFLGLGILTGLLAKMNINIMAEEFLAGAKEMMGAAMVIAFARAILVIATDGQIIDTIMFAMSKGISFFHPIVAAQLMFVAQTFINFFVPSGSGQAALTLPIMAPLADLVGLTRQTAVLAFQLGDGFTNMIIPTSGVTMGVLGIAKIPWQTWAKWLLPIEIILFVLGLLILIPPVIFNWGPF